MFKNLLVAVDLEHDTHIDDLLGVVRHAACSVFVVRQTG